MQRGRTERQIGHWVLTRLFRGCRALETLSLVRCSRVGDEELKELGVGCRGLVRLDLKDCNQVTAPIVVSGTAVLQGKKISPVGAVAVAFAGFFD